MSTPEIIYLIPGEDIEGYSGMSWCESSAPSDHCDPDEAVKYVRADTLPQPVLPQFPPEGEGMPRYGLQWNGPESPVTVLIDDGYWTPWHLANAENERLQARVAEKCDAPIGWIAPDKYRAACESKMEFFKTIKELREQNEKLKARVARLELEEIGAQKAFAAVADTKSAAESRVIDLEKSIRSLMTELYGKKRNDADQAGGGV